MYQELHKGCAKTDAYSNFNEPWDWELCYQCVFPCRELGFYDENAAISYDR